MRSDIRKMAEQEAPSSHPSTKTLKNKQKLSKLTLSELWKTKAYSNQSLNLKKKSNLKMVGRLCVIFTCPCHIPLQLSGNLKVSCSHSQCGEDSGVLSQEEKSRLHHKLCKSVLTCLEVIWRTGARCLSLSPNAKFRMVAYTAWKHCNPNQLPTITWGKRLQLRR